MIPILYESTETEFVSNGIGRLSDAISCKVSEEANGAYELVMQYSVTGKYFNEIQMTRYISAVPADGKDPQPFSIYKITKPLNGICTIYAEHLSYRLNHIPVMPFTAPNCILALQGMKDNAAEDCPFDFWTDKEVDSEYTLTEPALIRGKLGGEENSILQKYRGEYEWDKWTVKLHTHRGSDNGVVLRYGKNITSLTQEESIENVYTGVCPYWIGEDDNGNTYSVTLPEEVLHSENADRYPYQRTITLDCTDHFDEPPSVTDLRSYALSYMEQNEIGVPKVNVQVSFVALWQTEEYRDISALERVNLFDTVTVEFEELGVSAKSSVIKTDYDVLKERYISVTIGDAKSTLASTLTDQVEQTNEQIDVAVSRMERSLTEAEDLLTGGLGGRVVIGRNANGQPNEILVMDEEDKTKATNVLRINEAGIGFSTNGYNGPFSSAWTLGGKLNMKEINVVNLIADLIKGGTLRLGIPEENVSGVLKLYNAGGQVIGQMDATGLRMFGQGGSYVLMNEQVGFAGYDGVTKDPVTGKDLPMYWVSKDEFHMRKGVMDEEITLCNKLRFIAITVTKIEDGQEVVVNDGIGLVSVAT